MKNSEGENKQKLGVGQRDDDACGPKFHEETTFYIFFDVVELVSLLRLIRFRSCFRKFLINSLLALFQGENGVLCLKKHLIVPFCIARDWTMVGIQAINLSHRIWVRKGKIKWWALVPV